MADEKLRSRLLATIEGLEYIKNNAVIKNSENNNNKRLKTGNIKYV